MNDEDRGLYPKYRVIRIPVYKEHEGFYDDQAPLKNNGIPLQEVTEPFFLLKFDDPYARAALMAYAKACEEKYPKLAADIRQKLYDVGMVDEESWQEWRRRTSTR